MRHAAHSAAERSLRLVERDLELIKRYGDKVVDVDAPRAQLGIAVLWYKPAVEVWADGELCGKRWWISGGYQRRVLR